jgi:hypothetical protein
MKSLNRSVQLVARTLRSPRNGALIAGSIASTMVAGCASTQASSNLAAEDRSLAYDEAQAPSSAASSSRSTRATVTCDASVEMPVVRCAQCPTEPTRISVERGFYAAESGLQRCVNRSVNGLRVQAEFASQGVPLRFDVRGSGVDQSEEQCLRAALCTMRMPTFRTPSAIVRFEYEAQR